MRSLYPVCRVPNCTRPAVIQKHVLCRPHYQRWREGKPLDPPLRKMGTLAPFKDKVK